MSSADQSKGKSEPYHVIHGRELFRQYLRDAADAVVYKEDLLATIQLNGLSLDDQRLLFSLGELPAADTLDFDEFMHFLSSSSIVNSALSGKLCIPDFPALKKHFDELYHATLDNRGGSVATYIPQLARVEPEQYGVSVCTIDGQRYSVGDVKQTFCIQSTSKVITYCIAMEEHGEAKVHQHVGREPSGRNFNERVLNAEGLPHNPMINSGAIMSCSLVRAHESDADRFDYVTKVWKRLSGGFTPGFANSVYLSERATADRNFCLGYMMKESKAFPEGSDLRRTLEFYFQLCSIDMNCDSMSVVAATLANGGVCPITNERIFSAETVRAALSLMMSCGMYDYSGEFGWRIGLPAKSGVSGCVICVIPNVMGICTWSPRLDDLGNSVRGTDFFTRLVERFNFHNFDIMVRSSEKFDPRIRADQQDSSSSLIKLIYAAAAGDLDHVREMVARGVDVNTGDYDKRTALHVAASEGHADVVKYLLSHGAVASSVDNFGSTPYDEAVRAGYQDIAKLLAADAVSSLFRTTTNKSAVDWAYWSLLAPGQNAVTKAALTETIRHVGVCPDDVRVRKVLDVLPESFSLEQFTKAVGDSYIFPKIATGNVVVPEFRIFKSMMQDIFEAARPVKSGAVASYIPQLALVDPEKYALSVCTVDGQSVNFGDCDEAFCVQSTCKPINYCIAQMLDGVEKVHQHVGREPSGRNFNELALNADGKPHNPMINSGAIMTVSLVKNGDELADRFDFIRDIWTRLGGGYQTGFSNPTYLSERVTADRNFCLGYMMKEHNVFPDHVDLHETLELYFMCCSLEMTCRSMSVVAATLANGGVCPITGDRVFSVEIVKNTLSLMLSCGMYDYSGECQYLMGFPAKSGVSGIVICVIPGVMGFCVWSPRLDRLGNSVRGLEIMELIGQNFNFHMFDGVVTTSQNRVQIKGTTNDDGTRRVSQKHDVRQHSTDHKNRECNLINMAANGDLMGVRDCAAKGYDMNTADYDSRTPLHVAAANGRTAVAKFLINSGVDLHRKDRWGVTPLEEARKSGQEEIVALFHSAA